MDKWDKECDKALAHIKKIARNHSILIPFNLDKRFYLYSDASHSSHGAVLMQEFHGKLQPVAYSSLNFTPLQEKGWHINEKEIFSLLHHLVKWSEYILHRTDTICFCDNKTIYELLNSQYVKETNARIHRWRIRLLSYSIICRHVNSTDNMLADFLSRYNNPIIDINPTNVIPNNDLHTAKNPSNLSPPTVFNRKVPSTMTQQQELSNKLLLSQETKIIPFCPKCTTSMTLVSFKDWTTNIAGHCHFCRHIIKHDDHVYVCNHTHVHPELILCSQCATNFLYNFNTFHNLRKYDSLDHSKAYLKLQSDTIKHLQLLYDYPSLTKYNPTFRQQQETQMYMNIANNYHSELRTQHLLYNNIHHCTHNNLLDLPNVTPENKSHFYFHGYNPRDDNISSTIIQDPNWNFRPPCPNDLCKRTLYPHFANTFYSHAVQCDHCDRDIHISEIIYCCANKIHATGYDVCTTCIFGTSSLPQHPHVINNIPQPDVIDVDQLILTTR